AIVNQGHATAAGTARYAAQFPALQSAEFYRDASGLRVSSLGLGTYLGQPNEATDQAYAEAVMTAARSGINFFDTAINYRHQRSECAVGSALGRLMAEGALGRDHVVIATKAGFLTPGAVPEWLAPGDVVGR